MGLIRPVGRDETVRKLANWMGERLVTGRRADREDIINMLIHLSPEERQGIWKLRAFCARYTRSSKRSIKNPTAPVLSPKPRIEAWAKPA